MKVLSISLLLFFLAGCASSSYVFSTNPDGATVYYKDPNTNKKLLLGTTPLEYSKSALKDDQAFLIIFEKEGFFPESIPLAPTNEVQTTVNINMKRNPAGLEASSVAVNDVINRLFKTQKLIYQKRYRAAVLEIDKLLEEKSWVTQAHIMKGTAFYLMNELPSAIVSWKKALELDPQNEELLKFMQEKNIKMN
ncbi:MAG: hypothetical protein H6623_00260 [Bdellovibrionaceae bacterium]|nr:hypothetical protein [Pseudobdellovibrionaceae bacterium]